MFKKYFLLITALFFCTSVESAHFARRAAQFAKQYPGPLVGAGLSAAGCAVLESAQAHHINNFLRMEKDQAASGIINPDVKRTIKDECARYGWTPDFIVFEDNPQFKSNMGAISDGVRTGLVVGSGWGLSSKEAEALFSEQVFRFAVGHQATHARYHDKIDQLKVISLQNFLQGLTWHVLRASGRGKAFSLFVGWIGTGLSYQLLCVSSFNKWREFRADKESVKYAPENRDGGIAFFSDKVKAEQRSLEIIRAVVKGKGNEFEQQVFPLCLVDQVTQFMTHPSSTKRIERLQAMKVDSKPSE